MTACAQDATTGALNGTVHDAGGAAVAHAFVTLHNAATGRDATGTTDSLGEFLIPQLAPGDYQLRVSASGFAGLQVSAVTVAVGQTTRLPLSLPMATVLQTVDVRSEPAPAFDLPVNDVLSPEELGFLPLDGRRFQSFAALTPLFSAEDTASAAEATPDSNGASTASDPQPDTDNQRLSARGLDPMHNSYALEGLSLTRAFDGEPRGGRTLPFTVPQAGVREFQVHAAGAGVHLGRDAGGAVNTVMRRGETALHGSAFALLRNSGVGASNPFALATRYNGGSPTTSLVKPRDQREQFGGSVGGPLLCGAQGSPRLFGFVAAEGQRRSFPAVSSPSDPTFYALTPMQTALLANRGVNATAIRTALGLLDSLTGEVSRQTNELALLPRLDWQPSAHANVTAAWAHVRFASPSGQRSAPVVARGRASLGDLATHTDMVLLTAAASLSPHWLGTARAGWSRDAEFAETSAPLASEPHTGPGGAAPEVSIEDTFTFGNAAALGSRRLPDARRPEPSAEVSFHGSAHTVTLGADVSGIDERVGAREGSSGAYDYTSGDTNGRAGGLVDFITDATYSSTSYPNGGCPSIYAVVHLFCFRSFTQTFGTVAETRFHTAEFTAFADDTWRATPRLQLSLGVRYEYNRLPPAQHPNAALDSFLLTQSNDFATSSSLPADTNNLAPHAGIAWAPGERTVVRLGYGFHFGRVPGRTLQAALENTALPVSQTQLRLSPRTIIDPACASAGTNFGYPATYTCSPFGPVAAAGAATVFARSFQMPAVQTAELSVTHAIGRVELSGTYVLALARQLQNTTDLNVAPATNRIAFQIQRTDGDGAPGARNGQVFNVPLYTARRTASFGPVTGVLSNGNGTYHALVLQAERRSTRALTLRASWTYSKALDNVRTTGPVPNEDAQFDPFEPRYDRAPSNFDRRNRVVAAAVWQPRFEQGSAVTRTLLNGWSASPVVLFTTGRPYSYDISGGTALAGGRESLNGSGGAAYLPSVGRNTLRLPSTANVDLRVDRTLFGSGRHGEGHVNLRLSAEAFNLFNHVNVTAVEQRAFLIGTANSSGIVPLVLQDATTIAAEGLTTRAFGTSTSSADSPTRERRLQGGLRLDW